ncbi:nuclear transport factor 2 family protein [Hymenobacter sp. 5317J-9]|uniref:YybH family protein n=1 Tax=Hymenobacter sp. 5317J-9 TaxID=2932250 RepID=UPI001FD6A4EF|nr:nuclear transport factor 2 family protein [Hymenobacter sp. 5317J-9]UOQ95931.1 nuclear transport factor 2 family protein [Hymenobacter sp. 5317J-9]
MLPALKWLRLTGAALALSGCATTAPAALMPQRSVEAQQAIREVLTTQAAAWNRGDIPGFMQGYWKSDSLVFIGRKGPTYGWQPTLDNYVKNYPNAAAMGQLDFSGLRITLLAPTAAQVVGQWHLARPVAGDVGGYFLLVLRQVDGQWKVVADHTNSAQ